MAGLPPSAVPSSSTSSYLQRNDSNDNSTSTGRTSGKQKDVSMFEDPEDNTIIVVWHKQEYTFELPPPEAPLSDLRKLIADKTGVPPEHQKLIWSGAVMQKDLPLKTYGLVRDSLSDEAQAERDSEEGSLASGFRNLLSKWGLSASAATGRKRRRLRITMIGSPETSSVVSDRLPGTSTTADKDRQTQAGHDTSRRRTATGSRKESNSTLDEPRVVAQIDSLVSQNLLKLKSSLDNLFLASKSSQAMKTDAIKQQHLYVSEMLLQTLLKLDSFDINPAWTEARRARKEGIKTVQGLLDQVDALKDGGSATKSAVSGDSEGGSA